MHVIADAGAVGSRIVAAIHIQRGSASKGRIDHQRNQMRFGTMILPQAAGRIGTGGIEIAQAGAAKPMHLTSPAQRPLDHPFTVAISRLRVDRRVLGDRRIAVQIEQRGGGGQHEPPHAMPHAAVDQPDAVGGVVQQIAHRHAHAFAHLRQGGEVEHRVPVAVRQHGVDRRAVIQVRDNQCHAGRNRLAMARQQIIQHGHTVTPVQQRSNQMAADITCPAGDQKTLSHKALPPKIRFVPAVIDSRIGITGTKMHAGVHSCHYRSYDFGACAVQQLQRV